MNRILQASFLILSVLLIDCSNLPTSPEEINLNLGQVYLKIDKENAPADVIFVEAFLTRENHDTLYGVMDLQSPTSADILFENVDAGEWHLLVNAKDSAGVILYTGETDLTVLAGVLTQVNLTLVPTGHGTGNVYILVTWGTGSNEPWIQINFPNQSNLYCVQVINSQIAYVGGQGGLVYKTADAGETWIDIRPQTSVEWYCMYFVDENHGWVGGRQGTIARTTDGGISWNINSVYSSNHENVIESMYFYDNNIGYITGGLSVPDRETYIYKTTNGGQSWNLQLNLFGGVLLEMSFVNQNTGYVVGTNGGVFKTTNGGNTWNSFFVNTGYWLRSVYFFDSQNGVVMGQSGQAWKTSNGANSWNSINTNVNDWIESVFFFDQNIGWGVGGGGLGIYSTDGGNSWTSSSFPTSNYLWGVHFKGNAGMVVGNNGTIFKSNL